MIRERAAVARTAPAHCPTAPAASARAFCPWPHTHSQIRHDTTTRHLRNKSMTRRSKARAAAGCLQQQEVARKLTACTQRDEPSQHMHTPGLASLHIASHEACATHATRHTCLTCFNRSRRRSLAAGTARGELSTHPADTCATHSVTM